MSKFTSIFEGFSPKSAVYTYRNKSYMNAFKYRNNIVDMNSRILFNPEILYLIIFNTSIVALRAARLPSDSKEAILSILDLLPRSPSGMFYIFMAGEAASIRVVTNGLRIVGMMIEGRRVYLGRDAMEELGAYGGVYSALVGRIGFGIASWRPVYSVGIRSMDEQHKTLFEITNNLFESLVKGTLAEDGNKLLSSLKRHAEVHFKIEESLMDKHNYPGLEEHRRQHNHFTRIINSYYEKYQENGLEPEIAIEMLNVTRTWIRDHILEMDKRYEAYFKRIGARVE